MFTQNVYLLKIYSLLLLVSFFCQPAFAQEKLFVASQTNMFVNTIYLPIYEQFEKETGIKVIRVRVDDIKEFDNAATWYTYNEQPIDIINGQVTSRLLNYYKQGRLRSLNDFWQKHHLDNDFPHIKNSLVFDGQILAIPHSVYTWQIFYAKALFSDKLTLPTNLKEMVNVCQKLTQRGIVPFHIMNKNPWAQMAWFEYLTLRIHGLTFYNQLTEGKISYHSPQVKEILLTWQTLIEADCFSDKYGAMNWANAVPYMLRGKIAMIFNGPSIIGQLTESQHRNDVDFFSFPKINNIPRYETAPINAFHASKLSKNTAAIDKFLYFMAQPKVHEQLTAPFSAIPANIHSTSSGNKSNVKLTKVLSESSGTSTFFDRKIPAKFEVASRPYFNEIVITGDIEHFMTNMERLRQLHY